MMRSVAVAAVAVAAILLSAPVAASATCAPDTAWHVVGASGEPGFQGGAGSDGTEVVQFRLTSNGNVDIEGKPTARGSDGPIFTLPAGYRPNIPWYAAEFGNASYYVEVLPTGDVSECQAGSSCHPTAFRLEVTFFAGPDCGGASGVSSGMTNPMTTAQDLIVAGASGAPGRLAVGSSGQVLAVGSGGAVGWASAASTSFSLASFSGDALATINQGYSLVLVIGALLVLGVGYTIASGLRK